MTAPAPERAATAPTDATRAGSPAWPWLLALLLLILPGYAHLLRGDTGAIGRDFGMLFLDAITQQREALLQGHVLLWDPSQVGGTAFWPLPNQAPLYPPLMLCLLVRGAIEGLNLCIFLHVCWGALGVWALVRRLGRQRFAALVGGVLFAYAHFTRLTTDILPLEGMAGAWIPWALFGLVRAVEGPRWLRWSVAAGLAYAAVPWLGGFIQFLPGLVVAGTIVLVAALRQPSRGRLLRGLWALCAFGLVMTLVSAGKLLPMWHWIALTDRAGGITEQFALGGSLTPEQSLAWLLQEGWAPLLLLVVGVVLGARRRDAWTLPFAVAAVVLVLIASGPLYKVLYRYVPGFSYVREPQRVWLLMPAVLPVAAGLGLALLQDRLRLSGRRALLAGAAVLALVAADMIVWSRYELPRRQSLSERLAANAIHQDLARRAREEPRFRVIDIAKARARVKQTADLMRSSLGLESMEGILGNVAIQAYDVDYLNVVRDARANVLGSAKLLGLMNCRYVTSAEPVREPGLVFAGLFEADPSRPFAGIDGPLLYRNELALPRASLADHALLQVGGNAAQQSMLLVKAIWDPRRTLLVKAAPEALAALSDAELRRFDGAVLCVDGIDALHDRLQAAGVSCFTLGHDDSIELREWLVHVLAASTTPLQAIDDPPRAWNSEVVSLPEGAGGRWLLLAETCAIYPGWTAKVDGASVPLFTGNAVTTAILLPEGAREVRLDYVPPGLVPGLAVTLAGLLLAACVLLRRTPAGP